MKLTFINTVCNNEKAKKPVITQTSANGLLRVLRTAKEKYSARRTTKAKKQLARFSARVNPYGVTSDAPGQHHREYATLVWGGMKVLSVVWISPTYKPTYSFSSTERVTL